LAPDPRQPGRRSPGAARSARRVALRRPRTARRARRGAVSPVSDADARTVRVPRMSAGGRTALTSTARDADRGRRGLARACATPTTPMSRHVGITPGRTAGAKHAVARRFRHQMARARATHTSGRRPAARASRSATFLARRARGGPGTYVRYAWCASAASSPARATAPVAQATLATGRPDRALARMGRPRAGRDRLSGRSNDGTARRQAPPSVATPGERPSEQGSKRPVVRFLRRPRVPRRHSARGSRRYRSGVAERLDRRIMGMTWPPAP
jgi:hypothetical protein